MGRTTRTQGIDFTGPRPSELLREIEKKQREAALNTDEGRLQQVLAILLEVRRGFRKVEKIFYTLSPEYQLKARDFVRQLPETLLITERSIAVVKGALEELKLPALACWHHRTAVKTKA